MDDLTKKYVELSIRNWQLEAEILRLHKDINNMVDKANDLFKFRRGIALFCPLAAGHYNDFIYAPFVYDWRYEDD